MDCVEDVAMFAWFGLAGGAMAVSVQSPDTGNQYSVRCYPVWKDGYGNDIIDAHARDMKANMVVSLIDSWVMQDIARKVSPALFAPWFPIDHEPIPQGTLDGIAGAYKPLVYSKWAYRLMTEKGLPCEYIPHGIEPSVMRVLPPEIRAQARKEAGVPDGAFLCVMVAANKGYPDRKAFQVQMRAFAEFAEDHDDAILYMHTDPEPSSGGGLDLIALSKALGIEKIVRFPPRYELVKGMPHGALAKMYNTADVYLGATMSEGFGIPNIEAQACGIPVIVNGFSSMPELVRWGQIVPPADKFWTPMNAWTSWPDHKGIREALKWAYAEKQRPDIEAQKAATSKAIHDEYDWSMIVQRDWRPFLETAAEYLETRGASQHVSVHIPESCQQNGHEWATTGLFNPDGSMGVPCKRKGCTAELKQAQDGTQTVLPSGFGASPNGVKLDIEDDEQGGVAKIICREIERSYDLDSIPFKQDDVVIDIGAHVGIVSIYLAKRYPFLKIYAYEPVTENFRRLERNIDANGVENVVAYHLAVSADGRDLNIAPQLHINSGGSSAFMGANGHGETVKSVTLESIFRDNGIVAARLLKIDCEGAEYEIIYSSEDLLERVDYVRGEFHMNEYLASQRYTPEALHNYLASHIPGKNIKVSISRMADEAMPAVNGNYAGDNGHETPAAPEAMRWAGDTEGVNNAS